MSKGRVETALWYLGVVSLSLSVDTTDTTTGNYPCDKVPLPQAASTSYKLNRAYLGHPR